MPELPERSAGLFELSSRTLVGRVVYRLLRSLGNQTAVENAVSDILPNVTSLSSKLELVSDVGYRKDEGHRLVSEATAKQLEMNWRDEVRATAPTALAGEARLLWLLLNVIRHAEPSEAKMVIDESLALPLLKASYSEVRSQSMGSRAVRRRGRLAWDALVEILGDERILDNWIERLEQSRPVGCEDLLLLAGKYRSGWRPNEYGDE